MNASVDPAAGALMRQAMAALSQRNAAHALDLLRAAEAIAPRRPEIHMQKAAALRMAGDIDGALAAFETVLGIDQRNLVALLSKAALLDEAVGPRQAAQVYRRALPLIPDDSRLPPALVPVAQRARDAVRQDIAALQAYLQAETLPIRRRFADAPLERFDASLAGFAGASEPATEEEEGAVRRQPLLLRYRGLPAIPFPDRNLFAFLPELEASTGFIVEEFRGLLADMRHGFRPYIQYPPSVPVNQWGELNHSPRWSSAFLWENGQRHDAACERCPRTAALMQRLPLMRQPGFAPNVVFSALEPHTHIPPHTGSASTRLLCHLPLILPGPARFRVGPETREWRMGEAWVFDDTIEHEAWNDADEMRVILIIDLWSPFLSEAERALIPVMMAAKNAYYATPPAPRRLPPARPLA